MKSLGDTLRSAREERGISVDQVVHETNISRNYLEALENEDFEVFPAEAYLIGFLRNYAGFLGLDQDRVVGQFRNYKLSEEPTPIEQLVGPPKGAALKKVIPWVLIGLALVAAAVFGVPRIIRGIETARAERAERQARETETVESREIRPGSNLWEGEVRPSDVVILTGPGGEVTLEVGGGDGLLSFSAGETGEWSILMGEEIYIPGKDGLPAWRLYLKDLGLPGGGGIVEVQVLSRVNDIEEAPLDDVDTEPPSGSSERIRESFVIVSAAAADRYTLDIAFRDFSLFRYKVDGQDTEEAYYADGENFRLDVGRTVTLWVSNAGAVYAKIAGTELPLGRRGEVVVYQIRWVLNDETRQYDLTLLPIY